MGGGPRGDGAWALGVEIVRCLDNVMRPMDPLGKFCVLALVFVVLLVAGLIVVAICTKIREMRPAPARRP